MTSRRLSVAILPGPPKKMKVLPVVRSNRGVGSQIAFECSLWNLLAGQEWLASKRTRISPHVSPSAPHRQVGGAYDKSAFKSGLKLWRCIAVAEYWRLYIATVSNLQSSCDVQPWPLTIC